MRVSGLNPDRTSEEAVALERSLRAVAAGDEQAREWLYRRFSPPLFRRLSRRYGGDRGLDVEELLHDLFVWCYQDDAAVLLRFLEVNPEELRTEFRLEGYLWGLLSGLISNQRRSHQRKPAPLALDELAPVVGDDAVERSVQRDTLVRLQECLSESGRRLYLYFILRYVEGVTPDEIVRVLGWPRGRTYKMKGALNKAIARCVERLGL